MFGRETPVELDSLQVKRVDTWRFFDVAQEVPERRS